MKRRWKILITTILVLLALVAILLSTIHFQSKNKVEAYKDLLRAKGEKLLIAEVKPKPIPSDQDSTEIVRDAFKLLGNGIDSSNQPSAMKMMSPGKAMIGWAQPMAHVFSNERSNDNNTWEEIGLALDRNRAGLELLESLSNHPAFDFQLNYDKGFLDLHIPHLAPLKRSAQVLSAAAIFDLHDGDTASATTNVSAMLALVNGMQDERFLISQLVRIAIVSIAFTANWELLQSTNLTDGQLATLQKNWEQLEFIEAMENAFLIERACGISMMDKLRNSESEFQKLTSSYALMGLGGSGSSSSSGSGGWLEGLGDWAKDRWHDSKFAAGKMMWRVSWSYSDELHTLQAEQVILESIRLIETNQSFQPALSNMVEQLNMINPASSGGWAAKLDFENIREIFDGSASLGASVRKVMVAEVTKRVAIAAIALKRYQLKHGNYPANLSELVPEFLSSAPVDPVDGKPLRYRLNPNETFLLYSIGPNAVDDGGDPTLETGVASRSFYWSHNRALDWVWPQPATPSEVQYYFEHPPK